MSLTTKVKVAIFFNHTLYNKTVIDFNFGRRKDLSSLSVDIRIYRPR